MRLQGAGKAKGRNTKVITNSVYPNPRLDLYFSHFVFSHYNKSIVDIQIAFEPLAKMS